MGRKMAAYMLEWSLTLFRPLTRSLWDNRTIAATALPDGRCFTTRMSQQRRWCHCGTAAIMAISICCAQIIYYDSSASCPSETQCEEERRGRQRGKNVIKPSLPPLVYCALPRGASEMLRHDEGMPDRAGGRGVTPGKIVVVVVIIRGTCACART